MRGSGIRGSGIRGFNPIRGSGIGGLFPIKVQSHYRCSGIRPLGIRGRGIKWFSLCVS
jgi:hypothetical protein